MEHLKIAILIMAMCTFGMAQTKTADKKPAEKSAMTHDHDKAAAPAGMEMPKPSAEAQKLYSMVGTWSATVKTEPGPWGKGGTDKGSMTVTKAPGGFGVEQNFKANGSMGPFTGHGTLWWDKTAQQYKGLWCDSMGGCMTSTSKMEGDKKWTVEMQEAEMNGKKVHSTINGSMSDDNNSMREEFMQSFEGSPATKTMTIDYKRTGKAMAAKPAGKE
jgi:hypothetical protein